MNSCIYEGWVRHRRLRPVRHEFRYAIALPMVDLDELDTAFRGNWLWSTSRRGVATIRREDHFGDPRLSLKDAVLAWLQAEGIDDPIGSVRLLTQARYWGYLMNPVSFFFCTAPTMTRSLPSSPKCETRPGASGIATCCGRTNSPQEG